MSNEFNPYHKWLGIPLSEQPADHYRLLGLVRFESDPDVITGASDQRMQFLHSLQNGDRGKLVDKLLNEIANAKVCLLNKEKKAAYDQKLRAQRGCDVPSAAAPLFETDAEPTSQRRGRSTRTSRRTTKEKAKDEKPTRPLVPIIAAVVVTLLLIGGGLLFYLSGEAKKQEEHQLAQVAEKKRAEKADEAAAQRQAKQAQQNAAAERGDKRKAAREAAERKAEEEAKRKAAEEAKRKAAEEAKRKAAEEAKRQAEAEAKRKTEEEAKQKAEVEELQGNRANRAAAKQRQGTRQQAHRTLAASHLVQLDDTWRLLDLEKQLSQLAPVAGNNVPLTTPDAVRTFMKSYSNAMLKEFQRRTIARIQEGKPVIDSQWMLFMARNHPEIDPSQFGLSRNRGQKFYDRATKEAQIFDKIRFSTGAQTVDSGPGGALAVRQEIQRIYQLLDENTEVKTALQILGQRLGDPPIDATKLRIVGRNASSLTVNPFSPTNNQPPRSEVAPPSTPNPLIRTEAPKNNRTAKAQTDAIALLKDKGLGKGKDGWSPKELVQRLTTLEKEVENLQPDGLTPAQEKEVRELMKVYYQKKFAEWAQLDQKGLARARAQGFEPGTWSLPTPEARVHRYLRKHLLALRREGDPPKLMPDAVMEEDARMASLQFLTKKNPRYLMQANLQRKKKLKQIKTLEKKIRMRIRSLQKEPEVQEAIETLGSKFDPRFAPK